MPKKSENQEKEKKFSSEKKKSITVNLDIGLVSQLDKRAKKNYQTLRELIEDIIRRSMITYSKTKSSRDTGPEPEKFVKIFSRKKPGRKPKK